MSSRLLLCLLFGSLASSAALAQNAPAGGGAPVPEAIRQQNRQTQPDPQAAPANGAHRKGDHFAELDKDKDGTISRDEAAAHPRMVKEFDAIDTNKDGKLDKAELMAHHKAMQAKRAEAMGERFKKADTDNDGSLTKEEATAGKLPMVAAHFDLIDANKDGKVTEEELKAFGKQHAHHGGMKREPREKKSGA